MPEECTECGGPTCCMNSVIEALDTNVDRLFFPHRFDQMNVVDIADALARNKSLVTLRFRYVPMDVREIDALCEALKVNKTLRILELHHVFLIEEAYAMIAAALKENDTLEVLELSYNMISENGITALADMLKVNRTLTTLDLSINDIMTKNIESFADALKVNTTLKTLDLSINWIDPANVIALAEALRVNTTLTDLRLRDSRPGKYGIKALSKALKINSTLQRLQLRNCHIRDFSSIADMLRVNKTLTMLDLAVNKGMGDVGARILADALKTNVSIKEINMLLCDIYENGAAAFIDTLRTNKTLVRVDVGEEQDSIDLEFVRQKLMAIHEHRFWVNDGDHAIAMRVLHFLF